jgi:hypothetical protein
VSDLKGRRQSILEFAVEVSISKSYTIPLPRYIGTYVMFCKQPNEQSRCSQGTRTLTQPESANKHLFCRLKLNKYARETVSQCKPNLRVDNGMKNELSATENKMFHTYVQEK